MVFLWDHRHHVNLGIRKLRVEGMEIGWMKQTGVWDQLSRRNLFEQIPESVSTGESVTTVYLGTSYNYGSF